jgi:hypothetical protein
MCTIQIIEALKREESLLRRFFFNVYLCRAMWANNELLIKSDDGRIEQTLCAYVCPQHLHQRLASLYSSRTEKRDEEKYSKENFSFARLLTFAVSLLLLVFARTDKNRHVRRHNSLHTHRPCCFLTIVLIAVGVQRERERKKARVRKRLQVNSPWQWMNKWNDPPLCGFLSRLTERECRTNFVCVLNWHRHEKGTNRKRLSNRCWSTQLTSTNNDDAINVSLRGTYQYMLSVRENWSHAPSMSRRQ